MYTMEDFKRDYVKEHFAKLTPQEQREALERLSPEHRREVLQALPVNELLTFLSAEQIQQLRDQLGAGSPTPPRKPRRRK